MLFNINLNKKPLIIQRIIVTTSKPDQRSKKAEYIKFIIQFKISTGQLFQVV